MTLNSILVSDVSKGQNAHPPGNRAARSQGSFRAEPWVGYCLAPEIEILFVPLSRFSRPFFPHQNSRHKLHCVCKVTGLG